MRITIIRCQMFPITDLTVAGCGVCMMLPGTILPPGMGVLFFLGYTSVIFRFGRNFSRSDGLQFLQCRQHSVEYVVPT